jgi:hypothetical protein
MYNTEAAAPALAAAGVPTALGQAGAAACSISTVFASLSSIKTNPEYTAGCAGGTGA